MAVLGDVNDNDLKPMEISYCVSAVLADTNKISTTGGVGCYYNCNMHTNYGG